MIIADKVFVTFEYKLTLDSGEEVDSSPEGQPLACIMGTGQIIPGLEKAMMGKAVGDNLNISVEPGDAYGQIKPELFQDVPMDNFPSDVEIKPGMIFQGEGPQGRFMVNVKEIKDENTVTIDFNHPLAGERLHFDVNIVTVRELTAEEMAGLSAGCGCGVENQSDCGTKDGCC